MTKEKAKNILNDIKVFLWNNPHGIVAGYRHIDVYDAITKLLQEPYEDAISRQAVLDAFWKLNVELRPSAINAILSMVNDMPSVNTKKTGRWIPVSEKLPMNDDACCDDDVLVSCEDGSVRIGFCMGYDELGNREWCISADEYSEVIAWMPLPQPYKGESEK